MQNDRTSYIGLFLIGAVLFGWMYFNKPSEKQLARQKAQHDSIARVDSLKKLQEAKAAALAQTPAAKKAASNVPLTDSTRRADSLAGISKMKADYGIFYPSLKGDSGTTSLENNLIKMQIANRGGKVESVTLKDFKTSGGKPLVLFMPDSTHFGLILNAYSRFVSTDSLYFSAKNVSSSSTADSGSVTMRLNTSDPNKYLEYIYTVKKGSYMVGYTLHTVGLNDVIAPNTPGITLNWSMNSPSQENNIQNQQRTSTVYYKFADDNVDYLSTMKDEKKSLPSDIRWVSFKQQFFSAALIADTRFGSPEVHSANDGAPDKVKNYSAMLSIPYAHKANESFGMQFFFGPLNYKMLKRYSAAGGGDLQLERQINLGWGIFGWVNRFLVIQIFDFLSRFNLNYGLVILILTVVLKALLFPIAFRTYKSSAKMRLLKPETDELNKKFPNKEDAMKKQQALMALYKKAGVSPMAGCLPMLLQLPILYALFSFFPASIELRQKSFLWAHDLSTYDNAIQFHHFSLPFLGDHISMFAVLMTISQYLYLTVNQQLMGNPAADQMGKIMKYMMYLMPIIFLGVLNRYSAGLSYYYFLANLITFGQTYLARLFINEDELHRKMQENKAKVAKPSKFQQRLETMMKEQQARQRNAKR